MANWLSSSKVRLGLLINGLYFISLAFPSSPPPYARARTSAHTYEKRAERLRSKKAPAYAPLTTTTVSGLSVAETHYWREQDQLDVYLTNDLTLVRRRGHTLLLSPTYATKVLKPGRPHSVLLRFVSFSHEQFFDRNSPFVITADGVERWRYGARGPGDETPWNAKALYSAAFDDNGQVVETLGHELPYDIFVQVVGARRVMIELGDDMVELTPQQMESLRDMHRHLPWR